MKFSIVVPCRDDQSGLDRAIESLFNQTLDDFEVIVVDDGSARPIVVPHDRRVRLVRRETSGGPAAARNIGLSLALGDHIGFCDSDDEFAPTRLQVAAELHESADVVVVGQSWVTRPKAESRVPQRLDRAVDTFTPHLGATTVRREKCLRFDERFLACQDVEWWIRIVGQGLTFVSTGSALYLVGSDDRLRVLNSPSARLDYSYALLETHPEFYRVHRRARAFRWRRIAVMERREGSRSLAVRALGEAIKAGPTASVARELLRLLASAIRRPAVGRAGQRPLPPITRTRARRLLPLRRGTHESRQRFDSPVLDRAAALTAPLPRSIRGRVRRAMTLLNRNSPLGLQTSWGALALLPTDLRYVAPYADEPLEVALLSRYLGPGMTAIDIGANRGWYSLMFSARVGPRGRVVAVEPDPRMLDRLRSMHELNALGDNLIIESCAVAASSGQRQFVLCSEASLNHLSPAGAAHDMTVSIKTVSYPDLVERLGLGFVDLVKIDVEGAEAEIVGSILRLRPSVPLPGVIMFEYEASHWERAGHSTFEAVWTMLDPEYSVFAIDYERGGLVRVPSAAQPTWLGRNLLAVLRPNVWEVLRRMQFGLEEQDEVVQGPAGRST